MKSNTNQTDESRNRRPKAVTALALVLFGVSLALWIDGILIEGDLNTRTAAFPLINIAAAFGLLRLSAGWRKYVLLIAGYWGVLVILFGPWAMMNPERVVVRFPAILAEDRPHQLESWLVIVLAVLANAAAASWAAWVLLRRDVRECFAAVKNRD